MRSLAWMISATVLTAATVGCGTGTSSPALTPTSNPGPTETRAAQLAKKASPNGPIPRGWKVYRGTRVPFVVAYPPSWTVDASGAPVGEISFLYGGRSGDIGATVTDRGRPPGPVLKLAVLRSRLVSYTTRVCETGSKIEKLAEATFSRVTFATATVLCGPEEEDRRGKQDHEVMFYVGAALMGGAEWTFTFHCDKASFAANRRQYFTPMLKTLNIYAHL